MSARASHRGGDTTVGIVGCGPAGLVLAHLLQNADVPYVIVERHSHADVAGAPKAGIVEYRTVELLRAVGIADTLGGFTVENRCCEFRTPESSVVLDYAALAGGRPHFVYPQHELVARLCEPLVELGADIRFETTAVAAGQTDAAAVLTTVDATGRSSELRCEVLVGCDGGRSVTAAAVTGARVREEALPVRWLAFIGLAPPLEPHTIYAAHPRGFAGHMRRGPNMTRFYLEVPVADDIADWPEERRRAELTTRLGVGGELDGVAFVEPSLVDLRMRMMDPMQQGRLFLAGDAAHLITPAGGKGMNLAVQDAVELAHGLVERFAGSSSAERLDAYSRTRLVPIWRTQAFSAWMLRLILARFDDDATPAAMAFTGGIRQGWISALEHDPLLARWFAHAYAGVDPEPK
jgi:p-hydroxybenzoate 3-monooxygenase